MLIVPLLGIRGTDFDDDNNLPTDIFSTWIQVKRYGNDVTYSTSYYPIAICVSCIAFVLWEVYELIYIAYTWSTGFIQSDPWGLCN